MIRRVVLFAKKPEATSEDFALALGRLQTLDQRMSGMASWWVRIHPGQEGMWDAALVADFEGAAELEAYEGHPEHVAVATVIGTLADFAVFDGDA